MRTCFCLSPEGKDTVDNARKRKGWTRTSKWWLEKSMVSESTLKRFLRGEAVSSDIFIALCQAVGLEDWQGLVDWEDKDSTRVASPSQAEPSLPHESPDSSEPSRVHSGKRSLVLSGVFDEDTQLEVEALLEHLQRLLKKSTVTIHKAN